MKIIKRLTVFIMVLMCMVFMDLGSTNLMLCNAISEKQVNGSSYESEDDKVHEQTIGDEAENEINSLSVYINDMKSKNKIINAIDLESYMDNHVKDGQGNISLKQVEKYIINMIFDEVNIVLKLCISIIIMVILCSMLKNLQDAFSNESISDVAFYACYTVIILILSKSFMLSVDVAKDVINDISEFMSALLPVLITMISVSGGLTTAATLDPVVLFCVIFIPKFYANVILPLILMEFVLEFVNNLSTKIKIGNLCDLFKKSILWMQGIIVTVFIGILTVRGISSSAIDAVTLKTAKYAIDNFIPVVGKAFSDAISSVAGYSLLIKNSISSIGLIIIVLLMLYPLIKLVLMTLAYKLTSAVIEPISDSRILKSLESAGSLMTLITSCVLTVSLMSFILLSIIASCGKYVIGG